MGNEFKPLFIHNQIRKVIGKRQRALIGEGEERELYELCNQHFYRQEEFMLKNNFRYIMQLSNPDIFKIIFDIFGRKKEDVDIITFDDIKYLYFTFTTENPKVKAILISFLLFKNKTSISSIDFNKNIFTLFNGDLEIQEKLTKIYSGLIGKNEPNNNAKTKKKKNNEDILLNDLIEKLENKKFIKDFHFKKKYLGSSEYNFKELKKNENLNYICDCAEIINVQNNQDNLNTMKNSYDSMTSRTYKVLYMNDFKNYLEKSNIHKSIINIVIDYLKKNTQKEFCGFNDIKNIFKYLNYSLSLNDKKIFLFKMLLSIYGKDTKDNKLTYKEIEKYLDIDYIDEKEKEKEKEKDESKEKDEDKDINNNNNIINKDSVLYSEEDFINNTIFDEMINKLNPYLENFGLIPYSLFKAKVDDKKIKRRIIKDILKNENMDDYEKYLETKFDEYNTFYAIDIKFWNSLMNEDEEAPDYINNSNITEEINIVKEEDKLVQQIQQLQQKQYEQRLINKKVGKRESKVEKKDIQNEKDNKNNIKNNEKEEKNKSNETNKNNIKNNEKEEKNKSNEAKNNKDGKENVINEKKEKDKNNEKNNDNKNIIKEENKDKNNKEEEKKENKENEENAEKKEIIENKEINILTKIGNLKKGLKYKKDFILLCGDLYQTIKNYYRIDYIIKLKRIKTNINLKKSKSNENNEKSETNEKPKQEEENTPKEKEGESTNENVKEKNEEEKENDEEYIKNEKLVKEKLNELIIDEDKGLISKVIKDPNNNDDNKYILYELDFYPIKAYVKSFGIMVRMIESAKQMYDRLYESKMMYELSQKEQDRIRKEKEAQRRKENEIFKNRRQKFYDEKEELDIMAGKEQMTENEYEIKLKELEKKYEDLFNKREKNQNDYEVDITMDEFLKTLKKHKNTILLDKNDEISIYPRSKTFKDIKNSIVSNNKFLKEKKFDFYYFLFNSETLFKPNDDYAFETEGKEATDLTIIIVDIYSDKGENFNQLLINKENEKKEAKNKKDEKLTDNKEDNKKNKKVTENKKKDIKKKEPKKPEMTEEQKKKLKEEQLEREKKEKERKLKEKQERERIEKLRKEQEKKLAQEEKERKKKQKEMEKERELQLKRQKELEKFTRPPYGITNFGNTCYFNSVNQIFLNLPIIQQLFLDPKINYFINRTNTFGRQGKFFEIYKSLFWIKPSNINDTVIELKKMVGIIKEDFNNTEQQDANEYLNLVLENLHEELNLHSTKRYIEEKDDIFKHNTDEELGNISWANNLKRNTSFIDSLFMFQLKSNLKCRKCKNTKINFETNYIFDLPLSLCKMVTVEIFLYRLPFIYKLYYDKINKNFANFIKNGKNKNISMMHNLWNYYTNNLTIEEKKQHIIILRFSFDLEREKKMMDIIKIIRGIKPLDLEPENIQETHNNDSIIEYKIEHLTDFITYSKEKHEIIYPNSEIDKYVNIEDKIILNIYEVLNTKGMEKLLDEGKRYKNLNLFTYLYKKNLSAISLDDFREILKDSECIPTKDISTNNNNIISTDKNSITDKKENINIFSFKEKMILYPKEEISETTRQSRKIVTEFVIPIYHYWRAIEKSTFLFRDFYHKEIKEFPVQYIILNNLYNLTTKQLYDYIWNLNALYMNHPNINTKKFWWNNLNNEDINKDNIDIKKCYPFVLRYYEIPENSTKYNTNLIHCPICPWHSFCPGCIIDPRKDLKSLTSKYGIVVDWCYSFVLEEFESISFQLMNSIDNQVINENLPKFYKEQSYQSIKDCFDLFFEEENLEDPLYCHNCQGPEDFSKRYTINRLPYVLILSLKRFKFNKNSNFKLRQMITYPLYDLEMGNETIKKKYDLYGIINHYGSISGGHYTAIIKNKNKEWIMCDDNNVYKIEENRVMHSNAYILFYISKDSPYQNDYIKFMKSIMNNIIIKTDKEKEKKEISIIKDVNFFKGEPVKTKYGEGYVIKENLVDFNVDENYDIYDDLKKEDNLRVEELNKKFEKEDNKKNKKDKEKDNKENNKEDEKEKNKNEKDIIKKKEKGKDEINENKIIEKKGVKKEVNNKKDIIEQEKNKTNLNIINNNDEKKKNEKKGINNSLPEYYNNFLEIKFDYGKGWINKNNVKKYNVLEIKEEEKSKKGKGLLSILK